MHTIEKHISLLSLQLMMMTLPICVLLKAGKQHCNKQSAPARAPQHQTEATFDSTHSDVTRSRSTMCCTLECRDHPRQRQQVGTFFRASSWFIFTAVGVDAVPTHRRRWGFARCADVGPCSATTGAASRASSRCDRPIDAMESWVPKIL